MGCCRRARDSTALVVIIVFFSLLTDSMLLTLVDPILPDMLMRIENPSGTEANLTVILPQIQALNIASNVTGQTDSTTAKLFSSFDSQTVTNGIPSTYGPTQSTKKDMVTTSRDDGDVTTEGVSSSGENISTSDNLEPNSLPVTTPNLLPMTTVVYATSVNQLEVSELGSSVSDVTYTALTSPGGTSVTPSGKDGSYIPHAPVSKAINQNGRFGFLVAAKGAAQFICNPFVGLLVTRFGYRKPMLVGSIILMSSTIAFAFGSSYAMLFVTRIFQGMSSSLTAVTGMGLLAATFTDDHERGKVMGYAIGGLSAGIIIGPIYGSLLYQFFGQAMPFLVVALMIGLTSLLMVFGYKSDKDNKQDHSMWSILQLAADPYILLVAANVFLLNLDVSVVLAFLPMRLIDLSQPDTWQLGVVVLPTSIGYLFATVIVPRTVRFLPRWICGMVGLIISAATLIGLAFSFDFLSMLIVTTFLGTALGMVSVSMQPIFALLVDLRHSAVYGNAYAISDMSVCLATAVGPLIGGPVVYALGFQWMVIGAAILNLICSAFCIFLRNPTQKFKKESMFIVSDEDTPLLRRCESPARSRTSSVSSLKSDKTISSAHYPRYPDYLSGLERFWSEGESGSEHNREKQNY